MCCFRKVMRNNRESGKKQQRMQWKELKGIYEAGIATLQASLSIEVITIRNNSNYISDALKTALPFHICIR